MSGVLEVTAAETRFSAAEGQPRAAKAKRLTARDKQLLVVLAVARYLSREQLQRLFFPTRQMRTAEQHLEWLSGLGSRAMETPVLRRLTLPRLESLSVRAWALTPMGYQKASEVAGSTLKRPEKDIGLEFLAHALQLNELFTALLEPPAPARPMPRRGRSAAQVYARAPNVFRWVSSESARLPWQEYDAKAARRMERVILPDAVLELPSLKRRLFLECEMGTHSIVSASGEKSGSTISKAERYHQYCRRLSNPVQRTTYYAAQYADGYEPGVLFLVERPERAKHINQALTVWRKGCTEEPVKVRGVTFADAAAELRAALGLPSPAGAGSLGPAPSRAQRGNHLPESAGKALGGFFFDATRSLQELRHRIRAVPAHVRAQYGLSEPAYPKDTREVSALLQSWGEGERR